MTDRTHEPEGRTEPNAPDASGRQRLGSNAGDLIQRIQQLRTILPVFAQETAAARREAARLRSQNATLQHRVAELEARFDIAD